MTHEEFARLVADVETTFRHRPEALRWRVLLYALLGYAGLLFWLLVIVLVSAAFYIAMFWVDPAARIVSGVIGTLVLVGGGGLYLRGFYVQIPAPEGEEVHRPQAPKLFEVLDLLQQEIRSVPFDHVLVVNDCNAAVVQVPRLGLLGWSRNYLLLGLPLCEALSTRELKAVLAHEFAHLSREHGRMSHWLYRMRRSWEELCREPDPGREQQGQRRSPASQKFLAWFWPKFNAHAFVLSRTNEFEADAQAARSTDRESLASALIRIRLVNQQLNANTWPEIWQLANAQPEPPSNLHQHLEASLRAGPKPEELERWLMEAFKIYTSNTDTHPCLTDRLGALGMQTPQPRWNASILSTPSAAEELFGEQAGALRERLDRQWAKSVADHWRERHARANVLEFRLASLGQAAPERAEDVDVLWDRALALMDLKGDREVQSILRQILVLRPLHLGANFHLGRLLLAEGLSEGEGHLARVMENDENSIPQACALLHDYHRRAGHSAQVREIERRLDHYGKELENSRKERSGVFESDEFIPHGLSPIELAPLLTLCRGETELFRAQLVQKQLRHFPRQRLFILIVHRASAWYQLPNHDSDWALVNRISRHLALPGRVVVLPPSGEQRAIVKKISKVTSANIYHRSTLGEVGRE